MDSAQFHEKLLEVWIGSEGNPDHPAIKAYGKRYVATMERDGTTLYTCPAQSPVWTPAGYRYEDGLSYIFVDPKGSWRNNFQDREGLGQGCTADFRFFLEKHDIENANWLTPETSAPKP